jgi:transposase
MARTPSGQAIKPERRAPAEVRQLKELYWEARRAGDLDTWRRAKAVSGYLAGKTVISLAAELDVARGTINSWLGWYNVGGAEALRPRKAPGPAPKLTEFQQTELAETIDRGPIAAGFTSGVWTGPMVGEWIRRRFGVKYHNHHIPRILHQLGFSLQRPRRRLCRADKEAQVRWLHDVFPAIKKKPTGVEVLSSLGTRRASGLTEHSSKHGRVSECSPELIPMASARRRTSSEQSA